MDLQCLNCGEPWDSMAVFDEDYRLECGDQEDWEVRSAAIFKCPCCKEVGQREDHLQRKEIGAAVADLLGDDVDGAAAMLEDAEWEGLL